MLRARFFLSFSVALSINMFFFVWALVSCLRDFGIINLININIITDRSSNFIKAFALYEPIYCFSHRINIVPKVYFFQQQQNKIKQMSQALSDNISLETHAALTNTNWFECLNRGFIKFS